MCSHRCVFHRNTLIECGEDKVVVSTVGNYHSSGNATGKADTIGYNKYYETMAFRAKFENGYWEADVSQEFPFKSDWSIGDMEDEVDNRADKMHNRIIGEIGKQLLINNNPNL
jgi:hypothetical protein